MLRRIRGGLAGLALMALALPANASLIGDTVGCDVQASGAFLLCSAATAVVGGGVEFQLNNGGVPRFDIDIGASSFSMTFIGLAGIVAAPGTVLTIDSLDWVGVPNGVITGIDSFFTTALRVEQARFTVNPHSFVFDIANTLWFPGNFVSFDFVTGHEVIPEPSALALFSIGILGLGALAARKRRRV